MFALAVNTLLQLLGGCVFGIGLLGGEHVPRVQTIANAALKRFPSWLVGKWSPNIDQELASLEADFLKKAPAEALGSVRVGLQIAVVLEHAFGLAYAIFLAFCLLAFLYYVLEFAPPGALPGKQRLLVSLLVWAFFLGFVRLAESLELAKLKSLDGLATEFLDPMNLHVLVIVATYVFVAVSRQAPATWADFVTWIGFAVVLVFNCVN